MGMEERMTLLFLFHASCRSLPIRMFRLRSYLNEHMSRVANLSLKKLPKNFVRSSNVCQYCHSPWQEYADKVKVLRSSKKNERIKRILSSVKSYNTFREANRAVMAIHSLRNKLVLRCRVCKKKIIFPVVKSLKLEKKEEELLNETRNKKDKPKIQRSKVELEAIRARAERQKIARMQRQKASAKKKRRALKLAHKAAGNNGGIPLVKIKTEAISPTKPNMTEQQIKQEPQYMPQMQIKSEQQFSMWDFSNSNQYHWSNGPGHSFPSASSLPNQFKSKKKAQKSGMQCNPYALQPVKTEGQLTKRQAKRQAKKIRKQAEREQNSAGTERSGSGRSLKDFLRVV